jgi:hypothetical protein
MEEEGVLWSGTAALLSWGCISVCKAGLKKGDKCLRGVAAFTEASVEFFQIGETVVGAGGQAVYTANHAVNEAREDPRRVGGMRWQVQV